MGNLLPSSAPSKTQGLLTHASPHPRLNTPSYGGYGDQIHHPDHHIYGGSRQPRRRHILYFLLPLAQPQHEPRRLDLHRRRHLRRHGVAPPPPRRLPPGLHPGGPRRHRRLPAPSAALLLPRLSTNLRHRDPAVSLASSDYPPLLSELSSAGLFERKGHTTVALLSIILALLVLSVAGVVLSDRASVHALSGALMGLACIHPQEL
ncbi:hypothetical protein Fmac_015553 [Flemingia macrophylla]|uniref:Uncharacterized protein n=1 Tax=Flemingia macrophylla TaxID=520843 RepID=A0ABD1MGZ5_9FABA